MKKLMAFIFAGLALSSLSLPAQASSYPLYGTTTYLNDFDVDYYSPAIELHRLKNTYPLHELEFNVARYIAECAAWQQVCTAYDAHGRCIRWENQCIQWFYHAYSLPRRIEIDFRGLQPLGENEEEVYQVQINRVKPPGTGDDWVTTWFDAVKTKVPVKITRWGDYKYQVDPKPHGD